jgi:hypothetical protein
VRGPAPGDRRGTRSALTFGDKHLRFAEEAFMTRFGSKTALAASGYAWMAMVALAAAAPGCKPKTAPETMPTTQATAAASPPAPSVGTKATAATTATRADTPFEGEIQVAVYEPSARTPASIAYDIKGNRTRTAPVNGATGDAHVVVDLDQHKGYAVVDTSKSYATLDVNAKAAPPISKTGKMERVQGRDCEDWVINDAGERFDVCAAKGIAYFDPPDAARAGGEPGWAAALTKERAFPLRVVATDKAGKQEFRAEATKIEPKRLDDALFKVPSDYRVVPLSKTVKVASVP